MSSLMFFHADTPDGEVITVMIPGDPKVADSTHPNFAKIKDVCLASMRGEPSMTTDELVELFDVSVAVKRGFSRLSERVTVENGEVCLDGDPVESGLTKQIVRFLDEGESFEPLVNFMEKIAGNPNDHSRDQAWDWLNNHDFTITDDGDVVAYKGVTSDGKGGYRSGYSGHAFVDDEEVHGHVPNYVGAVVTMPRSEVAHDPSTACHSGLHVGTFRYAKSYAQGAMLRVLVNPRDIVSVPTDARGEKIRVCRYVVDSIIDAPDTAALYRTEPFTDDDEQGAGGIDLTLDAPLGVGDRVIDSEGDEGTIVASRHGGYAVKYDAPLNVTVQIRDSEWSDEATDTSERFFQRTRIHGKGGPTSQAAKGRGRNPAQDDKGRFSGGRPGSSRDPKTGRFA
jgi:hypothetical protein